MTARRSQLDPNDTIESTICRNVLNGLIERDTDGRHNGDGALDLAFHWVRKSVDNWLNGVEGNAGDVTREFCCDSMQAILRVREDRRAKDVSRARANEPPWLRQSERLG